MGSNVALSATTSFMLDVEFSGLVLVEQIIAEPFPGTYILLPAGGSHPHSPKITIDDVDIVQIGEIDLYYPTAASLNTIDGIVQLSHVLGHQAAVKRPTNGKPNGMKSIVRLPLPQTKIVGTGSTVTLEFERATGETVSAKIAAVGSFSVQIPGSSFGIGSQTFEYKGQPMLLKIHHMPKHEEECIPAPYEFGSHHTDIFYPLLVGAPSVPKVRLIEREEPCTGMKMTGSWGVDPAQCWAASI